MSSPPSNSTYLPYQAYKSKRHSRNLSSSNGVLMQNQSPPPISRPSSGTTSPIPSLPPPKLAFCGEQLDTLEATAPSVDASEAALPHTINATDQNTAVLHPMSKHSLPPPVPTKDTASSPVPGEVRSKKTTFRRLPAHRNAHSRNVSMNSSSQPPRSGMQMDTRSPLLSPSMSPDSPASLSLPLPKVQESKPQSARPSPQPLPVNSPSIMKASSSTAAGHEINDRPLPSIQPTGSPRRLAPYRPGFQPLGVRRHLTDDFLEIRRMKLDGEGPGDMRRVERTKLERRLEKLIILHFPEREHEEKVRPGPRPLANGNRRASIFDFGSLKRMSLNDAGGLWKGIVTSNVMDSAKNDLRAAEQRITPWQDDADVSKCPLCLVSFHPLTNRKHHCRLCGRIICSLPVRPPQRNFLCSTLFVVDNHTRQIEEVGEGVDYGVRKRRSSGVGSQHAKLEDDTKFLKGVRICHDCRPILLRQQYLQQALITPPYVELYQKFISLEWDIENALPKFQELIVSLNQHDSPTKEAVAARKHLLDSFAQYDRLAKKIRSLPCPTGFSNSQDRVQLAIMMRANLFLQKNMITLQSIPTLRSERGASSNSKPAGTEVSNSTSDEDAVAHALQPLLEQESLLEVFIEEAQSQRKFEDVKTLKTNLKEIRQEIEKLLDTSDT